MANQSSNLLLEEARRREQAMQIVLADRDGSDIESLARAMGEDPELCEYVAEAAELVTRIGALSALESVTPVSEPRQPVAYRFAYRCAAAFVAASFLGIGLFLMLSDERPSTAARPDVTENVASRSVAAWEGELAALRHGAADAMGAEETGGEGEDVRAEQDEPSDWIFVAVTGLDRDEGYAK